MAYKAQGMFYSTAQVKPLSNPNHQIGRPFLDAVLLSSGTPRVSHSPMSHHQLTFDEQSALPEIMMELAKRSLGCPSSLETVRRFERVRRSNVSHQFVDLHTEHGCATPEALARLSAARAAPLPKRSRFSSRAGAQCPSAPTVGRSPAVVAGVYKSLFAIPVDESNICTLQSCIMYTAV